MGAHLRKQELTDITAGLRHHLELAKMEWGQPVQVAAKLLDPDERPVTDQKSRDWLCSHIVWTFVVREGLQLTDFCVENHSSVLQSKMLIQKECDYKITHHFWAHHLETFGLLVQLFPHE